MVQTNKVRTREGKTIVSDYSVGGGDTLSESDNYLHFLTVPSQNSSCSYTLGEPITPNLHSSSPPVLSSQGQMQSLIFSTFLP